MAENTPDSPLGAVPPKPAEAAKVQPKKETVRINLPPKPSSSPTIKLPTLPPGKPGGSASPTIKLPTLPAAAPTMGAAPTAAPTASAAHKTLAPPAGAPATSVAKPSAATAAKTAVPAAAPAQRPVVVAAGVTKGLMILAVLAMVTSLASLGAVVYLWQSVSN